MNLLCRKVAVVEGTSRCYAQKRWSYGSRRSESLRGTSTRGGRSRKRINGKVRNVCEIRGRIREPRAVGVVVGTEIARVPVTRVFWAEIASKCRNIIERGAYMYSWRITNKYYVGCMWKAQLPLLSTLDSFHLLKYVIIIQVD